MNEPLNLPRGTVRAVITILLVVASVATMFVPIVDDRALGMLLVLTGVAVRDYFATRAIQNETDGPGLPPSHANEG